MEGILGRVIATVLGLIALAGVVFVGNQALSGSKVSGLQADLAQLSNNARSGFSTSTGYAGLTTANAAPLINAGIIPPSLVRGGVMTDPWGNPITLAPLNAQATRFVVGLGGPGMTKEQCSALITGLQGYTHVAVVAAAATNPTAGTGADAGGWAPTAPAAGTGVWTARIPPDSVGAGTACDTDGRFVKILYQ